MKSYFVKMAYILLRPFGYTVKRIDRTSFEEKLTHNYNELTPPEKARYYCEIRPGLTAEDVFWFEGDYRLFGQLYIADRKALFTTILQHKPRLCVELGTYCGGGSTYFIAKALAKVGAGTLVSSEIDAQRHAVASSFYSTCLNELSRHVEFIRGESLSLFLPYIEKAGGVDFLFLDGAEDCHQSAEQFKFFEPYMSSGALVFMHDWNTEKMSVLKPMIERSTVWKKICEIKPPNSIGFAGFKRI